MNFRTNLSEVLNSWKSRMAQLGVADAGELPEQMLAYSKSLVKPIPSDICRLYEMLTPELWNQVTRNERDPALTPFYSLTWNKSLIYRPHDTTEDSLIDDAPDGPEEPKWLVFGGFDFGDLLVYEDSPDPLLHRILYVFLYGGPNAGGSPIVLGKCLRSGSIACCFVTGSNTQMTSGWCFRLKNGRSFPLQPRPISCAPLEPQSKG